ncbi:hypothetical protein ACJX0J_013020 [Zea mays]
MRLEEEDRFLYRVHRVPYKEYRESWVGTCALLYNGDPMFLSLHSDLMLSLDPIGGWHVRNDKAHDYFPDSSLWCYLSCLHKDTKSERWKKKFNDQNHQYLLKPTDLKQLTDIILLIQQPFHPSDHAILACGKLEDKQAYEKLKIGALLLFAHSNNHETFHYNLVSTQT